MGAKKLAIAKVNSLCWHFSSVTNYNQKGDMKSQEELTEGIDFKLAHILFLNSVKPKVSASDQLCHLLKGSTKPQDSFDFLNFWIQHIWKALVTI